MDKEWLKAQFDNNPGKSKSDLARKLGLEPPAISKILGGLRQIKAREYALMREFFGLPSDGERALEMGLRHSSYFLDPLGLSDSVNVPADSEDPDRWVIPANILAQRTKAPANKIKIFQIQENMMEPEFRSNEHVLVDLSDKKPSPPGVFVVSDGFGYMLRKCEFIPKSSPPKICISAHKAGFQPQVIALSEIEIIGRVIAKLQWL